MPKDWDVDVYKTEHENEEHWELRKNFMLAHKDKFSEEEVVCLAQVFTNIEFMGCRYPDQTMLRVAELAKGVVEKFREKRKNSLKRTFVAASDAASSKVKGQSTKKETEGPPAKKLRNEVELPENQGKSCSEIEEITIVDNKSDSKAKTDSIKPDGRVSKYGGVKTFNINSTKQTSWAPGGQVTSNKLNGPLGEFVLFYNAEDENSTAIINRSASINKCAIRWDFEEGIGSLKVCKLYLNGRFFATGVGENMKQSKENTAIAAMAKLRESYYGIKVKAKFFSDTTVNSSKLNLAPSKNSVNKLGEDNIGEKIMRIMGWQGGGLGRKGQGIEEPIIATLQVQRDGFGLNKNNSNILEFRKKARDYIKTWMESDSDQDLVFSSEFSSEERKTMHEIAASFSLKSRSYGKDATRQLVISRKFGPWDIVEELKKTGGSSDKYELINPKKPI